MRKQSPGLLLCAVVLSTLSCTKTETPTETSTESKTIVNDYGVASPRTFRLNNTDSNGRQLPSSTVFVTLYSGNYISSYEGGIRFGATLPHPITADPTGIHDGEAIPTIAYVNWTANYVDVTSNIEGAYFDLLEPTFPGAVTWQQITTYLNQLHIYYAGVGTRPTPLGSSVGSGGIREVKGILIRDHLSPTMMSVCSDTWQGNFLELATISKSPYSVVVYGPSYSGGTVNKVKVLQGSTYVTVTSFSLSYNFYTNALGEWLHVGGTVHLANGTVLTINSEILLVA